jgi:hypothetical protein
VDRPGASARPPNSLVLDMDLSESPTEATEIASKNLTFLGG